MALLNRRTEASSSSCESGPWPTNWSRISDETGASGAPCVRPFRLRCIDTPHAMPTHEIPDTLANGATRVTRTLGSRGLFDSSTLRLFDSSTPRLPDSLTLLQTPRLFSTISNTASAARPLAPGPPSFAHTSASAWRMSAARAWFVSSDSVSAAMFPAVQSS
jgi:hypothetical protein